MGRRALSIILSAIMIIGMLPTMAWAADYGDTQDHWAEEAIDRWSGYGVVNGKTNNTFDPEAEMTRAEAAQVFANLLGLNKEADLSAYADAQGDWFTSAIAKCVAAGILNGKGEGKMDPNGTITREEFLTMYARAVSIGSGKSAEEAKANMSENGFADAENISDWAAEAVNTLVELGFVNGMTETSIAPQANINRASVMALLDQSISTYVGKDSTETTVTAKSEGITLIANPAVTSVTGMADVVVVAAGAEQYDETTGEITHNDIRVESAKMPVARVQGENITVTLAVNTEAEDAEVTATAEKSEIVVDSTAKVEKLTVSAESAKATVSGKVESITVAETAKNAEVETKANSTVGTLNVAAEDAKTTVAGKVESVTVAETAKNAEVETKANSTVGTLNVAAEDAKTTVAGKVETVKVEETAKNVAVETKSTAKVETVENKAENTSVTGTGSVGAVKSSEDVKIETKNTKVENTNESKEIAVTDSKGAETKVDSGTTGQTTPSAPTGGGGGPVHSHDFGEGDTTKCSCGEFADDIVAAIGNQGYKTLEAALAVAANGQTVTLVKDVTGTIADPTKVAFTIDKSITLDGNGKSITVSGDSKGDTYGIYVNNNEEITATIKNLTLNTTGTERAIRFGGKAGGTVKDSTVTSEAVGIHVKGIGAVTIDNVDIAVNTIAAFTAHKRAGVVVGAETTATMSNSKIVVNATDKTNETVTWGKGAYVGTGAKGKLILNNTDITADFALAIDGSSDENKLNNITVNSGTIKGDLGSPGGYSYKEIVINGGMFNPYSVNGLNGGFYGKDNATARMEIFGGTFSAQPDAKFVATGYAAKAQETSPETWTVATFFASGSGTESDPFLIANLEELKKFSDDVNAGSSYANKTVALSSDLDMRNITQWTPINGFAGTFDGKNHTIKTPVTADIGSLFGRVSGDVVFKDVTLHETANLVKLMENQGNISSLTFDNVDYTAEDGTYFNVGHNDSLYFYYNYDFSTGKWGGVYTVKDCDVNMNLKGADKSNSAVFVGGYCYYATGSHITVQDCSYTGTFSGNFVALVLSNGQNYDSVEPTELYTISGLKNNGTLIGYGGAYAMGGENHTGEQINTNFITFYDGVQTNAGGSFVKKNASSLSATYAEGKITINGVEGAASYKVNMYANRNVFNANNVKYASNYNYGIFFDANAGENTIAKYQFVDYNTAISSNLIAAKDCGGSWVNVNDKFGGDGQYQIVTKDNVSYYVFKFPEVAGGDTYTIPVADPTVEVYAYDTNGLLIGIATVETGTQK